MHRLLPPFFLVLGLKNKSKISLKIGRNTLQKICLEYFIGRDEQKNSVLKDKKCLIAGT